MKFKILFALLVVYSSLSAQETMTLKYFGLTIHPLGDPTAHLQPNKLDPKARFVANVGVFAGYEKFLFKDLFSVKIIQGAVSDCSNGFASVTHLGPRITLMRTKKHRVYFGIGPTLIVRNSWTRFGEEYEASGYFNETYSDRFGALQWKFVPYGLEFEYDYAFNDLNQLSVSFTPGVPLAMILSVGWKHWFHFKDYSGHKVYVPK
ncbi:MAG: hypothetical protein ACJASQ_002430 [Crocinitomicaceae bacterium]|jgi:hypothetical protein